MTSLWVSRLDLPEMASKARQGRWASTQVVVRKLGGKHRSVAPTAESCVSGERLAIQIFRRISLARLARVRRFSVNFVGCRVRRAVAEFAHETESNLFISRNGRIDVSAFC